MPITMKDHAWVWFDWDRPDRCWIVDCPECGKLELPGPTYNQAHAAACLIRAEHLANLHNARNHGGGHDAD